MNAKKSAYVKKENEKSERTKESKKQNKQGLSVDEQLDRFADLLLDIYLTAYYKNQSE